MSSLDQFSVSIGFPGVHQLENETSPAGQIYAAIKAKDADAIVVGTLEPGNTDADSAYSQTISQNDVEIIRVRDITVTGKVMAYLVE